MRCRPNVWIADLWKRLLGRNMTMRLMRFLIPNLLWNQEICGQTLGGYVNDTTRRVDAGCGEPPPRVGQRRRFERPALACRSLE